MTEANLPLHIVFIFVDGVGLGASNSENNPFCQIQLPHFVHFSKQQPWTNTTPPVSESHHVFKHIDATLGLPGLPQSGTGQATLFTGKNCAKIAGKHFGPFPHSKTRPTIAKDNVFRQVNQINLKHPEITAFANAYPRQFFEKAQKKNRWTVTTLACIEAGVKIRTLEDLYKNEAITAEITRAWWHAHLSVDIDEIEEKTAARHLASISRSHPFTLFEYYLTDKAGHSQSMRVAEKTLTSLDRLLEGLLEWIDLETTLLLLTSDHGNIEDLSTKSHTINDVPLLAYGKGAEYFSNVHSLLDVTPAIVHALSVENTAHV